MTIRLCPTITIAILLAASASIMPTQAHADDTSSATLSQSLQNPANPLHLTPDQQAKVDARRKKFQIDAHNVSVDPSLNHDQKSQKIADLEKAAIAEIKTYMTHDQRVQIQADQNAIVKAAQERNAKIDKLRQRSQVDAQDYKAQRQLLMKSITKDQASSLQALEADTNAQITRVRADGSITKAKQDEQVAAIMAAHDKKQTALFAPDQRAIIVRMETIAADAQDAERQINLINPAVVISPKL